MKFYSFRFHLNKICLAVYLWITLAEFHRFYKACYLFHTPISHGRGSQRLWNVWDMLWRLFISRSFWGLERLRQIKRYTLSFEVDGTAFRCGWRIIRVEMTSFLYFCRWRYLIRIRKEQREVFDSCTLSLNSFFWQRFFLCYKFIMVPKIYNTGLETKKWSSMHS